MKKKNKQKVKTDCEICTFWQRVGAFIIDMIILVGFGYILGTIFEGFFAETGPWGRLIGFIISAMYFGVTDSEITNGQSLGKKMMKIKVVNILGEPINIIRCFTRASLILLPFFLYGIMLPPSAFTSAATVIITFTFLSVVAGLIYFYIFNKRTRQAFHDIASGTYVVKSWSTGRVAKSDHASRSVPAFHFVIFMGLLIGILALSLFADYAMKKPFNDFGVDYNNVIRLNNILMDYDKVYYSYIDTGEGKVYGSEKEVRYLECFLYVYDRVIMNGENAEKMAKTILESYQDAANLDIMFINFEYGFDIGIARKWEEESFPLTLE